MFQVRQIYPLHIRKFYLKNKVQYIQFLIYGVQRNKWNIKLLRGGTEYMKLFKEIL